MLKNLNCDLLIPKIKSSNIQLYSFNAQNLKIVDLFSNILKLEIANKSLSSIKVTKQFTINIFKRKKYRVKPIQCLKDLHPMFLITP